MWCKNNFFFPFLHGKKCSIDNIGSICIWTGFAGITSLRDCKTQFYSARKKMAALWRKREPLGILDGGFIVSVWIGISDTNALPLSPSFPLSAQYIALSPRQAVVLRQQRSMALSTPVHGIESIPVYSFIYISLWHWVCPSPWLHLHHSMTWSLHRSIAFTSTCPW